MTTLFNRRDIGYTIVSRFEECYRKFLIEGLTTKYSDFREGIPKGIITKTNEKSEILFWTDIQDFFENTDFPDLLEVSLFKDNFILFKNRITKEELINSMNNLYGLRCKIAHVKGFFTSIDLDKLVELSRAIAKAITADNFSNLIAEIEADKDGVVLKVPLEFNIDFLESNGVINNLPTPDYEYEGGFVGREDDIKEIIKFLQRERFPVVTITGAGGVGKTSLALKVVQEITQKPKAQNFDAIVWLSAKENKLSPYGIEDIEPTFKNYEDLLNTIIEVLGFGFELPEKHSIEDKEKLVNSLFEISSSILVIIDNLETVTDERITNFIIDAPEKAKFLVTSRKGLGQVERRYELKQLIEKEAIYLFRQIAKDKQVLSLLKLENHLIQKYVNKVSNYPLAIKWVIGQVARGRDINKIIDSIDDATGDISKFCFEQIFGMLRDPSKQILFALCLFEEPPTFSLLKYVVELENTQFDDCIEELILVSLVIPEQFKNDQDEISRKFYILPLTKGYIRQQLNQKNDLRTTITKKIIEVEKTVVNTEQAKREYRFSMHNLGAVSEEEKIASIFTQTAFQKYQAGLYEEAVGNYKKAIEVAPKFSSVYRNWAVMESYEDHLYEADQLMNKASELNGSDPQIWLLWGNINRKSGKITEADQKYKRAFDLSPDNHIILNAYGQTRGRLGDYGYAYELLKKAIQFDSSISKKHEIINHSSIAYNLIHWAEYLTKERDNDGAEKKLFEALDHCSHALKVDENDSSSAALLVTAYYKIGKHFNRIGKPDDAIYFLDKAISINKVGYRIIRYKMKSAIELSKILYAKSDLERIPELLKPLTVHDNIFKNSPEILTEINQILDLVGSQIDLIEGKIKIVSHLKEFVIIHKKGDLDQTFIASKFDFNPKLNSLSPQLVGCNVKFLPKIFQYKGKEKREAKNIIIIN